jgi:hypothetical protein
MTQRASAITQGVNGAGPSANQAPADAPKVSTSGGMTGMLAAVTGLALIAVAAFWLIGTQPRSAGAGLSSPAAEMPSGERADTARSEVR